MSVKNIEIVWGKCVRFTVPSDYGDTEVGGRLSWPDFASAVAAARSTIQVVKEVAPTHYTRAFVALRMTAFFADGGGSDREVLRWEVFRDRAVLVPAGQGGLSDEQAAQAKGAKAPTSTASQPPKPLPNRWSTKARERLPSDLRIEAFLDEIEQVCRAHGMTISHEDGHGSFKIEDFDEFNISWLRGAEDSR